MSGFVFQGNVFLFGGYNKKKDKVYADLWALNLETYVWNKIAMKGRAKLAARYYHTFVVHGCKLPLKIGDYIRDCVATL
jgi:hypothetical protein